MDCNDKLCLSFGMDLRHLRHFVAVARTLHFGRAAAELHIAQPALSQSIRALEDDLGVRLLDRTNRRVELTQAGRALLEDAAAVLAQVERAVERVRLIGQGRAGRLRIGYTRSASEGISSRIVDAFRSAHPGVVVETDTLYTARNVAAIAEGRLDAAFVRPPLFAGSGALSTLPLEAEPFVVVMPAGHRLARRRRLRRTDLLDAPLVTGARERGPGFFGTMFESIWGEVQPRIARIEADEEHMLRAVAAGVGVTVITASRARALRRPGLAVRHFEPPEPMAPLALAWRTADTSPALARLLETARALAGHRPGG
jgi:DNA-binding transcriptional LysR family regulator